MSSKLQYALSHARQCLTLLNPVPWRGWVTACLGRALRMGALFCGWPVVVGGAHMIRRTTGWPWMIGWASHKSAPPSKSSVGGLLRRHNYLVPPLPVCLTSACQRSFSAWPAHLRWRTSHVQAFDSATTCQHCRGHGRRSGWKWNKPPLLAC